MSPTEFDEKMHGGSTEDSGLEADAVRKADGAMIRAALDELTDEFREVIVMRDIEGLSYKEIADAADLPIGTVMSRLARARGKLARSLKRIESPKERGVNCDDARVLMHGHLDGELDLAADLEVAATYRGMPAMRERIRGAARDAHAAQR